MRTVTAFPHRVRRIDDVRIPVTDGLELSARIWLPEDADETPVPAIFEYQPYRQRDLEAWEDQATHGYFAGHGYACIRCDIRGSGESDGLLEDEYLANELDDGEAALRWIAAQPWCNGVIGMMGMSWSGFNALQIAARRPPELHAVVTACSTDDRYADDIHYMGGTLLVDNLSWAANMFTFNTLPPDPDAVGERWRTMWKHRLENAVLWADTWLEHTQRDAYWKHGSVCEDYSAIACPVMAVSGWHDGYSDAVFRLLEHLDVPRKGLIGPWSHRYPHFAPSDNAIDFLHEALRWWDCWLKGTDDSVRNEPALRVWMQHHNPPSPSVSRAHNGRWVAEETWPAADGEDRVRSRHWGMAPGRLVPRDGASSSPAGTDEGQPLELHSPLSVGRAAGKWLAYSATPDLPGDQREDDGGSLVFDTAPLPEALDILGAPVVTLELTSDRPVAQVVARLSDVAPDGRATRVSYGPLNLTHHTRHEYPEPLTPGARYRVRIPLKGAAQRFSAGHRIRLALSTSYWPLVWPSPEPETLTVYPGASELELPVRPPRERDASLRPFGPAQGAEPVPTQRIAPSEHRCTLVRDIGTDEETYTRIKDSGTVHLQDVDTTVQARAEERFTREGNDVTRVRAEVSWTRGFERGDWRIRTETRLVQTCTSAEFRLEAEVRAHEGEQTVYTRMWERRIPRKLV